MNKPKILLVDDDRDLCLGLGIRLRAEGYEVRTASDGISALKVATRELPHLVLMDIGLPKYDGFEVIRGFRKFSQLYFVPIIIVSAQDPAETRVRAENIRAKAYFQKPVDNDALMAAIRDILSTSPGFRPWKGVTSDPDASS